MSSFSIDVHLVVGQCGHKKLRSGKRPKHAKSIRLPRVTRLMALAIKYEGLLQSQSVGSQRDLADLAGADRSHVSKILRLTLLSPNIQERLLELPEQEGEPVAWRDLDRVTKVSDWRQQEVQFDKLLE